MMTLKRWIKRSTRDALTPVTQENGQAKQELKGDVDIVSRQCLNALTLTNGWSFTTESLAPVFIWKVEKESEAVSDESHVPTDNDTLYSEFMQSEYVEWPAYDFSGSHDRAQLSAYQQIQNYSERQAQAIRDNHERVADWCNEQMQVHRVFSRVGSLSLNR